MSYQWGLQGPAFEYPTCYRIENRFLLLRGLGLIGFALVIVLVVVFGGNDETGAASELLKVDTEGGSGTPHVLAALLLSLFGGVEIVRALRQRRLLLLPGQPASLAGEVRREASGSSNGAAWLKQALVRGEASAVAPVPPYQRLLQWLAPDIALAPQTLHAFLQTRLAHLTLGALLLLLLGLSRLLVADPLALALAAALFGVLGGAVVARSVADSDKPALGPAGIATIVVLALAGALLAAWGAGRIVAAMPRLERLQILGLPMATAMLLLTGIGVEILGLLAGRSHVDPPGAPSTASDEVAFSLPGDPQQVMHELDRELLRRWTEGVPNRRHAWQPPQIDPKADSGGFDATVLEESQPMLGNDAWRVDGWRAWLDRVTPGDAAPPRAAAGSRRALARLAWLLALGSVGLLASAAGAVVWVRLAYDHIRDASAPWAPLTLGLALVVVGGYALRVAHLLWSRVEVESKILWIDFNGRYVRGAMALVDDAGGRGRVERRSLNAPVVDARVTAVRARSVFYAAAAHRVGSRSLLGMTGDIAEAQSWTQHLQTFALGLGGAATVVDEPRAAVAGPRSAAVAAAATPPTPATPPRPAARFCSACGSPVLQGARFCQQCGQSLQP